MDALAEPPRFGFRPFEQRHGHAHGRFGPEAGQPRQLLHERLQRFRDSVVHTSSFGWTENWGRGNLSSERLPALLSMPVSLGDASTGTARSGGAIRSSSPPQKLPLSFPKLLTLSNPCSREWELPYCGSLSESGKSIGSPRHFIIIIIIKSILRSAQQKKEGQMTFLFKFLAGLRGLEPRLTGPESVVLPIER